MRILVTGGAGYLGAVLCKKLAEKGYFVRIFDKLYFGEEPIKELLKKENVELVKGDIVHIERYPHIFDNVDAVIHLSGLSNDPSCDIDPEMTELVNVQGGKKLAQLAKAKGIKRFIFASSCSVYGEGTGVLTEESQLKPVSLYAKAKIQNEKDFLELMDDNFCPVILRMATLFGYSPRMRFDLAINLMTKTAMTKKEIFIVGGGEQWRPFLHVEDASDAYILCLHAPLEKIKGKVYNVGSNENNYQILKLAQLVKENIPELKITMVPSDPDKRTYNVNFEKIKKELGFKTNHDAVSGIREVRDAIKTGLLSDLENIRYYTLKKVQEWVDTPAKAGGEPTRWKFLPFALPLIEKDEEDEVIATLRSGWLTTGPRTKKFEEETAKYIGCKHAIALNSCTAALHLSLLALGIGHGDEVITTPITFAATINVIEHVGAKPIFVDVHKETLNIDADKIEEKITNKTKAIIPVHMAGQPCDMKKIERLAIKHNLAVVEDAAHAIGAEYGSKKIGNISDITCFSFYPIKNMTTIEGGLLTTNNDAIAEKARLLSLHGMSKDAWKRYDTSGEEKFEHWQVLDAGWKYNMTDVQAAIGIHQLKKLDKFIAIRQKYANMYDLAFANTPELMIPEQIKGIRHAHHLYVIQLELDKLTINRDEFVMALKAENIGTGIHFTSMPMHPYYQKKYGYKKEHFPNASYVSGRIISLPMYPKMTEDDINDVIRAVKKIIGYYKK